MIIVLLTAMNLRGVRESGAAFAVPVYLFMAAVIGMALFGLYRQLNGDLPPAASAGLQLQPEPGYETIGGIALVFLLLRAFSSGCAALTGVEAISNGVPAFKKPKSKNAATTLLLHGLHRDHHAAVDDRAVALDRGQDRRGPRDPAHPRRRPRRRHLRAGHRDGPGVKAVFDGFPLGVVLVSIFTGLILVLAANTAFNGFPVLGSILARDGFLPRQLHTRGDRLAFSNGIIILAAAAAALVAGLRRRGHPADPAVHRRRLRLVHAEPDRHGPALDPPPAGRAQPAGAQPDDAQPGHQRRSAP